MNRPEHALIGAGAGLLVAHLTGGDPMLGIVAGAFAGPLPDIDLKWAPRWPVPRPGDPCRLHEHRGPTHSLLAAFLVLNAGLLLLPHAWLIVGYALAAGYLSHLVADALSPMGLPFLWPLSARRYRLMPRGLRVPVGTRVIELPVAAALALACVLLSSLVRYSR